MACISCEKVVYNSIVYNGLNYCNDCYNNALEQFAQFEKSANFGKIKEYDPPVQIFDNLYIGNINSVNADELKKLGITKIIIAGRNLRNVVHKNFECLELFIDDCFEETISNHVKIANTFIKSFQDSKILIHCHSGISRSGSILIGYVMNKFNMTYDDAFSFVKNKYEKVCPNESFESQLRVLSRKS